MMFPKPKRRRCLNVPLDILSNLPGDAIDAILARLPLRDAVRTSILSKKWRYKWCRLPELTLRETDLRTTNGSISSEFKFGNIIYQILTLHSGPITKFTMCIPFLGKCPNIDNLIYFFSRNGIQHLVLLLPGNNPYLLPSSIFTCSQMRHLNLQHCSIPLPPSDFQGFVWLFSLELCWVQISSRCLENLVSRCPVLEHLVLHYLDFPDIVEINAPRLRYANIRSNVTSFCFKNSPLLEKLFLRDWGYPELERKCDIAKFFESLSALELLHLDNDCLEFLARGTGEVPTRLPFDLNCIKRLYLDGIHIKESVLSSALCLIRSSPYLQYLEIKVADGEDGVNISALESLEVEGFSDVSFSHLKEVKLAIYVGSKPEMQLMKLLLAKSPMLVRMQIELWLEDDQHESLYRVIKVSAVLNSFSRISPEAKVVIYVNCGDGRILAFD